MDKSEQAARTVTVVFTGYRSQLRRIEETGELQVWFRRRLGNGYYSSRWDLHSRPDTLADGVLTVENL